MHQEARPSQVEPLFCSQVHHFLHSLRQKSHTSGWSFSQSVQFSVKACKCTAEEEVTRYFDSAAALYALHLSLSLSLSPLLSSVAPTHASLPTRARSPASPCAGCACVYPSTSSARVCTVCLAEVIYPRSFAAHFCGFSALRVNTKVSKGGRINADPRISQVCEVDGTP